MRSAEMANRGLRACSAGSRPIASLPRWPVGEAGSIRWTDCRMRRLGARDTIMTVELRGPTNVPEGAATTFARRASPFAGKWMSKCDCSDHAQFYISVDGGGTGCLALSRPEGDAVARRQGRAPTEPRQQRKVREYAHRAHKSAVRRPRFMVHQRHDRSHV